MRHLATLAAASLACVVVAVSAQQQPAAPEQQPTFRAGVDVIRLDVSVLDKNRRPVRGLTATDFTVLENGKPQRIVALSEVDAGERDPMPTAWMRHVPRDVAANDLADQVGDGRLFGIIMDDWNTPYNSSAIVMSAREVARYVIDNLGPSDVAAVVFVQDPGKSQDFTDDRARLLAAVDRFEPREQEWVGGTPMAGPRAGDMAQQFAPSMARSRCMRTQPVVPTIDTVVARLATVPNRRKTLILLTPGVPLTLGSGACQLELFDAMKDVFWRAQRGNVNIHGIDPAGLQGFEAYLTDQMMRTGRGSGLATEETAHGEARLRHDFLKLTAENTGGRAVVDTDAIEPAIDAIFEEDGSYYLVGYETSNGKPDGKFRKIEVKINKPAPGTSVRSRSGYWATREGALVATRDSDVPTTSDLGLTGMMSEPGLPLRASVMPLGPADASGGSRDAAVGIVLSVRLPTPAKSPAETLTVTRNVYDADGKSGPPMQESTRLTVPVSTSAAAGYDVLSQIRLAPGRYQLRLNAHSTAVDRSGSIFADLEVPDFVQSALTLSALALGAAPADGPARSDALAGLLPIIPTSVREFSAGEHVIAFLRVFQGAASPPAAVDVHVEILDVHDASVFASSEQMPAEVFSAAHAAAHQLELPLARLTHGPYLLTITARTANGRTARRDLVFRVK